MEWSEKVEEMLQNNLKLEKELKNFKTTNLDKLKEESHQFDECLNASSTEPKRLQEESDGLLAKSMHELQWRSSGSRRCSEEAV